MNELPPYEFEAPPHYPAWAVAEQAMQTRVGDRYYHVQAYLRTAQDWCVQLVCRSPSWRNGLGHRILPRIYTRADNRPDYYLVKGWTQLDLFEAATRLIEVKANLLAYATVEVL